MEKKITKLPEHLELKYNRFQGLICPTMNHSNEAVTPALLRGRAGLSAPS